MDSEGKPMTPIQTQMHEVILGIAMLMIILMILPKPIIEYCKNKRKKAKELEILNSSMSQDMPNIDLIEQVSYTQDKIYIPWLELR